MYYRSSITIGWRAAGEGPIHPCVRHMPRAGAAVFELLNGGNRAHIGMIGLDLKCLQEFVHMGNEVKKLTLLKAHLSLPYQDLGDNEMKKNI